LVAVSIEQVRRKLGLTSSDITDTDVTAFIDEATAFLSDEINKTLNQNDCTKSEANAIAMLAAVYSYCKVTGGSAVGLSYSVGQLSVREDISPAQMAGRVGLLMQQVERFIEKNRVITFLRG